MAAGKHRRKQVRPRRPRSGGAIPLGTVEAHINTKFGNPRHASLILRREGGQFSACLTSQDHGWKFYKIGWSDETYVANYRKFGAEIFKFISGDMSEAEVSDFTNYSNNLFHEIFPDPAAEAIIRRIVADEACQTILVVSAEFSFPWAFLSLSPPEEGKTPDLIGNQAVFVRVPEGQAAAWTRYDGGLPDVVLVANSHLNHVKATERPYLERLNSEHKIRLRPVPAFTNGSHSAAAVRAALKSSSCMVHFACHGLIEDDDEFARLVVDDDFPIRAPFLRDQAFQFDGRPVVFINACSTAIAHPNNFQSFMDVFRKFGAAAVLAPDCEVGDASAAMFATLIYDELLKGSDLVGCLSQRPGSDAWQGRPHSARLRHFRQFTCKSDRRLRWREERLESMSNLLQ